MMPGAAVLAINQVQLWNECNKNVMFRRAGVMRFPCHFGKRFRSLCVHCFFGTHSPANVLRAFSATPLTIPAPGGENRHFVVHSPYAVCLSGRGRACIPAGRPLRPPPCGRTRSAVNGSSIFTPDQRPRFDSLLYKQILFAVKKANRNHGQVWMGPAENCRRVSVGPGEPAGMRVQGARSRDAESRPTREPGGISGGYREATIFPAGSLDC